MLPMIQTMNTTSVSFHKIRPGMELICKYRTTTKKIGSEGTKVLLFYGPVIQKTKYLIAVRDRKTRMVHCLSLFDCICGHGKYKRIA